MGEDNGTKLIIGQHDEAIKGLKDDMVELKSDVKQILANQHKQQGAWKAFTLLGTAGGTIAGLVVSYLGLGK